MMEEKENKPTCKDFAEYLKKCAEAYAKQQCHCKEHDVACHTVPLDDIDACREQEETEYHDVQSCRNYLRYFSSVYNPAGKDARDSHAHRHESKEKTGSCMDGRRSSRRWLKHCPCM